MKTENIFPSFDTHNLIFMGAFHLGIPLVICKPTQSEEWSEIQKELTETLSQSPQIFEVINIEFDTETNFPLGKPLMLKHRHFFTVFNLQKLFHEYKIFLKETDFNSDHIIWICPSGAVLFIGQLSFNDPNLIKFEQFTNVVEEHYAELAYLFTELAEMIFDAMPKEIKTSLLSCKLDIEKCKKGIDSRKEFTMRCGTTIPDYSQVVEWLRNDTQIRLLFDDILIDVYYIDFLKRKSEEKFDISYVSTALTSLDAQYILMTAIAYSSFIGLLWLQKHLNEQARLLEKTLIGNIPFHEEITELKLFRIFCLQFIQESRPISIRLTHYYMTYLEKFWEQSHLHILVKQVNEQLETLEDMFEWIDGINKERRNTKIGIAAVFLSIISITAVIAQLISTIDINYPPSLNGWERSALIFVGFLLGSLSAFAIYLLPISRFSIKRKKQKRKL